MDEKAIRDRLLQLVPKPRPEHKPWTLAPALTESPPLVGTAFDYLLRFELERTHPRARSRRWVAELAPRRLWDRVLGDDGEPTVEALRDAGIESPTEAQARMERALERARVERDRFIETGEVTRAFLRAVLDLGRLDSFHRPGPVDPHVGSYPERSLRDLENLYEAIPSETLAEYRDVWLNPAFGRASEMVGGADADLILDDVLVDIKTWERPSLRAGLWAQLVGYALLNEMARDEAGTPRVTHLGVYWSRQGYLWTHPVRTLYEGDTVDETFEWLSREAAARYGGEG